MKKFFALFALILVAAIPLCLVGCKSKYDNLSIEMESSYEIVLGESSNDSITIEARVSGSSDENGGRLNFSAEYIVWARKNPKAIHCFHYDMLKQMNGGKEMPDVWKIPSPGSWERTCGKHPTQKPLALLVRLLLMASMKIV